MICAKLKHCNLYGEIFWFVELGEPWPHRPQLRLIGRTSPDEADAQCFASAEEAANVLVMADNPIGWTIEVKEFDGTQEKPKPLPIEFKTPVKKSKPASPGTR